MANDVESVECDSTRIGCTVTDIGSTMDGGDGVKVSAERV